MKEKARRARIPDRKRSVDENWIEEWCGQIVFSAVVFASSNHSRERRLVLSSLHTMWKRRVTITLFIGA
jgi:steroid 5-alpha reductase family enzyme